MVLTDDGSSVQAAGEAVTELKPQLIPLLLARSLEFSGRRLSNTIYNFDSKTTRFTNHNYHCDGVAAPLHTTLKEARDFNTPGQYWNWWMEVWFGWPFPISYRLAKDRRNILMVCLIGEKIV